MRFHVFIGVFAGDFPSQQTAFAHLLESCPEADLEQVEVLARPFGKRLRHFFDDEGTRPPEPEGATTMVLTFPGSRVPPVSTGRLRCLGRFPGVVTRALLPGS